ncbi:MAG: hypothetical protein ACERKD_09940 [Prolixibacteraceae bacterium]
MLVNIPDAIEKTRLSFVTSTDLSLPLQTNGTQNYLNIIAGEANTSYQVYAIYEDSIGNKGLYGQLDIRTESLKTRQVVLVPVSTSITPDSTAIQKALNEIYTQYGLTWQVSVDTSLQSTPVSDWALDNNEAVNLGDKFLSEYSPEQVNINRLVKDLTGYDGKTAYLILMSNFPEGTAIDANYRVGEMPIKKQFGYLYNNNTDTRLIAHELGHGALTLQHTFDYPAVELGVTQNLMDYANGNTLNRFQWGVLHHGALWGQPFQDDDDGAAANDPDIIHIIAGRVYENGPNGCAFIRYTESDSQGEVNLTENNIEYVVGKYENQSIEINQVVGQPIYTDIRAFIENLIIDGSTEFIIYVNSNGEISYCLPQEDYNDYVPLVDTYSNPDFLQKFKTDYLNCSNSSNIYNLTSESITEEQKEWLDKLYKGESPITYNEETYHSTSAVFIYSDETTSTTDIQFAESFVPENGEIIIWVEKNGNSFELKSDIPSFVGEATKLTDVEIREQIINQIFDDYSSSLSSWDNVATALYEFFDATRKGIRRFRFPEYVWNCNDEDNYRPAIFWAYQHFISSVKSNSDKYKSMGGSMIEYELTSAFPGLKEAIESIDDPQAEFAFYCGVWHGIVETIAAVPEIGAVLTGALSGDAVQQFGEVLVALNRYESEDGKTGVGAALENGIFQSVNGNCKLSELGGEIIFVVALSTINPAALESVAGPALAKIIRVLQVFDEIADAIPGYALKFATNGIASLSDDAGRLIVRMADDAYVGKALRLSDYEIVDLPSNRLSEISPVISEGKVDLEINGNNYRLIDQEFADLILSVHSKFGRSTISLLADAYRDNIERIVTRYGLSLDEFEELIQRPKEGVIINTDLYGQIDYLTSEELSIIESIRSEVTFTLDENTIFEKAITEADYLRYIDGTYSPSMRGCVARAQDVKHLTTPEGTYFGLRLDYEGTDFINPSDSKYVFRFTTSEHGKLGLPVIKNYPNTGTGFTAGNNGYLGIPELEATEFMEIESGAFYRQNADGTEVIEAIMTINLNTGSKYIKKVY